MGGRTQFGSVRRRGCPQWARNPAAFVQHAEEKPVRKFSYPANIKAAVLWTILLVALVWVAKVVIMYLSVEDLRDAVVIHARYAAWEEYNHKADSTYLGPRISFKNRLFTKKPLVTPIVVGYTVEFGGKDDSVHIIVHEDARAGIESTEVLKR